MLAGWKVADPQSQVGVNRSTSCRPGAVVEVPAGTGGTPQIAADGVVRG